MERILNMSFNVTEFLNDMAVSKDDEVYKKSCDLVELIAMICEDKWLTRQAYFGMAGAMERQIEYLGEKLLPSVESRLTKLNSEGVGGESYVVDSWFGTSNSDQPYTGDDTSHDQAVDDSETFAEELRDRMRTAGIIFITHMLAHDDISRDINQLTYGQIKGRANANRAKATANTKRRVKKAVKKVA
jgi:hypothetical protein